MMLSGAFTKSCLLSLIALVAAGEPAPEQEVLPDPNDVYIESISTGGAGCPEPGTVSTVISGDGRSFVVIFDQMLLENPPGPPVKVTNCEAALQLHIPGGWQVALATVNTHGYAFLDPGLSARQTSSYKFAGNPLGFRFHAELFGPFDALYSFTDEIPFESMVWSECGESAIFAINTTLLLNAGGNPGGQGIFNSTDIDGKFQKVLHWQWRPC